MKKGERHGQVSSKEETMQRTQTGSDTCGDNSQTHRIVSSFASSLACFSWPGPDQSTVDIPTFFAVSVQTSRPSACLPPA